MVFLHNKIPRKGEIGVARGYVYIPKITIWVYYWETYL
jgi:hypothetical protein